MVQYLVSLLYQRQDVLRLKTAFAAKTPLTMSVLWSIPTLFAMCKTIFQFLLDAAFKMFTLNLA
jgi:hypothetical protein